MNYTNLGRTGLKVSRIALGMLTYGTARWRPWIMEEEASRPVVRHAVEAGINFFDTADLYSAGESEVLTGRFVREFCRREEVVISSKVFHPVDLAYSSAHPVWAPNRGGLSRKRLFHAIDASLQRLGTDYIDLWQIHRFDPDTPIEETMEALHDIVKSGKVRYLGASSMYAWQFAKCQQIARERGWTPFVSMQNHYNLAYREEEREMNPLCHDQGVALIPYSPLARGFLAGNRGAGDAKAAQTSRAQLDDVAQRWYYRDCDFAVVAALGEVAAARGVGHATVAYAWLLHKGVAAPVIGASKTWQLDQAAAACELVLSDEDIARLEAPYLPHAIIGHH
ncbi:aldo/keto reductase [Xylophilus sp. GOD-11R]|uniref:aldo/keto reductase n=1 Tax=Xylophilus sp. GOD-11R TaxID=3089814 RepID=UPI00298BE295|nr:aldo/keto reductase [Xylophilus sp. GOD-11R]WPB56067.1 aldo/keto reductase [Xylophilus sp. GOD-11R]